MEESNHHIPLEKPSKYIPCYLLPIFVVDTILKITLTVAEGTPSFGNLVFSNSDGVCSCLSRISFFISSIVLLFGIFASISGFLSFYRHDLYEFMHFISFFNLFIILEIAMGILWPTIIVVSPCFHKDLHKRLTLALGTFIVYLTLLLVYYLFWNYLTDIGQDYL